MTAAQAHAEVAADQQRTVDQIASDLAAMPDLLRVPLCVLAEDLVEKYGVCKLTAYRSIAQARFML